MADGALLIDGGPSRNAVLKYIRRMRIQMDVVVVSRTLITLAALWVLVISDLVGSLGIHQTCPCFGQWLINSLSSEASSNGR